MPLYDEPRDHPLSPLYPSGSSANKADTTRLDTLYNHEVVWAETNCREDHMIDERFRAKKNIAYEEHDPSYGSVFLYERQLASIRSPYQKIEVIDTTHHGRMLLIDDCMMLTEDSEFIYHEMMAHIPMAAHRAATRVVVIGGGDGGVVRELLKYQRLEQITLVEIDEEVIKISRRFFPQLAKSLEDPRVNVIIGDGVRFINELTEPVDVVIIDSTDPYGPAELLISEQFYRSCYNVLGVEGLLMQQIASPFFTPDIFVKAFSSLRKVFPLTSPLLVPTPFYMSGAWSLGLGSSSDTYFTKDIPPEWWEGVPGLRYYNPDIHRAAFALPNFVRDLYEKASPR